MQTSTEQLALIKQLNVIDDVFFHKIAEDKAVCEEILRIILQKPKLKVLDAQAQRFLRNISAHSVILDLLCEDEDGSRINVEMQKADDDDHVKRVRFSSSNIDTTFTEKGLDYKDFPDIYVIFISKFDMFQEGKTIYHAGIFLHETGTVINDGIHRIFVNCAVDDGSDIAELMQYFKNSTGKNNKFPKLSDRVCHFKESKEGVDAMTQVVEEYANKKVLERDKETAKSFYGMGHL
ncbi:Rpn family recombination-promoting nuclease/putative transposase [Acetatifactor aquisgranensis]|uniref:Rpn family recombination-promoting nuclease/putative transposase n=1 Tax=Acetatifactor aquisgranensis TaxID=2941233 RepID=UPI00203E3FDB|nr:Rpn family recombination-promoting nuclease/putative transposase [Acetatifactor aquisgranensis]